MLLLAWITTKGNYAAYRGGSGGGESKPAQLQELSDLITEVGAVPRKPKDIVKKIQSWETTSRTAVDWQFHTGAGCESPKKIETELVKRCRYFFELEPVMQDHGGAHPLLTNRDSDNKNQDLFNKQKQKK
jgi:hypothetical protein